ncbi:uncharacterized protein LOC112349190 [Selaginella moellendorffii]|uniref:uncharacterized protein LOC112349190 n=1 Tax=Selaginella moellendorffii TaxID=88036 RepID=UPI000D1CC4CE|nr:uncharacterized protein LOC112349190 [Selaginella moellendorffii]|eukprot:XP_024538909.1 uncharacterized protein LOC112349190 [Selaginella moellendorffii]
MASLFLPPPSSTLRFYRHDASARSTSSSQRCAAWKKSCIHARRARILAMGFKINESYDSAVELDAERDSALRSLLSSEAFCKQVAKEAGISETSGVEFLGELFQPVPWSPSTTHGMPQEFEKYHHDKENYVIINVPPNFMFKAKVFKPSRLCAIYRKIKDESLKAT